MADYGTQAPIVQSIWFPSQAYPTIYASVIASDAAATTYSLACSNPSAAACAIGPRFTYTAGPSSAHYNYVQTITTSSITQTQTADAVCTKENASSGDCVIKITLNDATQTDSKTFTATLSASDLVLSPITLTAGPGYTTSTPSSTSITKTSSYNVASTTASVYKTTSAGAHTKSNTNSSSTISNLTSPTTPTYTGHSLSTSATSASTTPPASISKAAAAMVTRAPWLIGGAAAALAFAAI